MGVRSLHPPRGVPSNKHNRAGDPVFQFSFAANPSSQSSMMEAPVSDESDVAHDDPSSESEDAQHPQIAPRNPGGDRMLTPSMNPRMMQSFSERRASMGATPGYPPKEMEDTWGASDYECFFDALHSDFDDTRDGGSREASRDRMMAAQRAHMNATAANMQHARSSDLTAPDSPSKQKRQRR